VHIELPDPLTTQLAAHKLAEQHLRDEVMSLSGTRWQRARAHDLAHGFGERAWQGA
jgi:hypothetical protein